ncbi:MAG: class I SAM-dependent methyltransferase [Lachnospiraceae bacterium]|nr:class I SAM-dependent methyltransferase [Lachnospiraceae bacterium]
MAKLSNRLLAAAALVPEGMAVLDVGCDHGYTVIELIRSGRAPLAAASDIREGPLSFARANIEAAGLSGKIKTALADGIPENAAELLPAGVPAALIITGMGGLLIRDILKRGEERLRLFDAMVLSPQSDPDEVRRALSGYGFFIRDEVFLREDGKYYALILAERGDAREGRELSMAEALYGPVLLEKRDPLLLDYLKKQLALRARIREQLSGSRNPEAAEAALERIGREEEVIRKALERFRSRK